MSVLSSQVERESDVFAQRRERMEALVAKLRERSAEVARGGGDKAIERHRSRGKLTGRWWSSPWGPAASRSPSLSEPGSA